MTTSNRQSSTANAPWCGSRAFFGCSMLTVEGWMLLFTVICLGGGFVNELRAGETSTIPTNAVATRILNESDVLALLAATLQRDYVKDRGVLELNFKQPWSAPTLPDEPLTVKILELPTVGVTPSFIIRFQLCTPRESLGTWQVTVQAHVWRDVWVAQSNLMRGEPVKGADMVYERCDVLKVREVLAEFSADDPNLELAEPVASGVPLLARAVKPKAVIHRGQVDNALVQDGTLSITTKVEVLEDGAPGQVIHARNPISRRNLTGQVLDGQTILISL